MEKMDMRKQRRQEFWDNVRTKINGVSCDIRIWWSENKEWAIIVIPAGVAVSTKVIRVVTKLIATRVQAKQLDIYYNRQVYDPHDGIKYETKRSMTAADKKNFGELRRSGMSVYDSLVRLNLL